MVQYPDGRLDASFAALSDVTRRGVLERLGRGDASISALAKAFHMTLTGMRKHVGVLEHAELVTTDKVGRVRTCRLGPRRLEDETAWIEQQRQLWGGRVHGLGRAGGDGGAGGAGGRRFGGAGAGRRGATTEGAERWTHQARLRPPRRWIAR